MPMEECTAARPKAKSLSEDLAKLTAEIAHLHDMIGALLTQTNCTDTDNSKPESREKGLPPSQNTRLEAMRTEILESTSSIAQAITRLGLLREALEPLETPNA